MPRNGEATGNGSSVELDLNFSCYILLNIIYPECQVADLFRMKSVSGKFEHLNYKNNNEEEKQNKWKKC